MRLRLWPEATTSTPAGSRVAPSRPPVALLRLTQRGVLAHPGRREYVEPGLSRIVQAPRVVVDQDHDRAVLGQPAQRLDLEDAGGAEVVVGTKHQRPGWQVVPAEPGLGDLAQPLGPPGEVDDVVDLGQAPNGLGALLEKRVLVGGVEEGPPVLGPLADVPQAVPDIGEHAVDVDDRDHAEVGRAHAQIMPVQARPAPAGRPRQNGPRRRAGQPTSVRTETVDPERPLATCTWGGIRLRISVTWLTPPTVRPPARRPSSRSMTSSSVSASRLPKPSSTNSVSTSVPPASWVTTSASPRARERDTTKVSPPDSVEGARTSPVHWSTTSSPSPAWEPRRSTRPLR